MTFELRPYQQKLVDETNALMLRGRKPCLVAPTGSGKTVILAELVRQARERGEKVVVAAHRNEIVKQILASLTRHLGEEIGVVTAAYSTGLRDVTVTMMPTLARRKRAVEVMRGRTFFLDEAHHICSPSYQRIFEGLEPARFAGATATPVTPTGKGLGDHGITDLVLGPEPRWLMDQGSLCDYRLYGATGEVALEGVAIRGGDYAVDQLNERVVAISGSVIRDYERFNPDAAPTIAVTVSIDHAFALAEVYEEAGYSAEVVIGSTPQDQRQDAFKRFESGELKVLVSVALIDEGLDLPAAACLQLLRPTRSIRLYRQLIGRVLRPSPGKSHAVIIDHGSSWKHLPLPDEPIDWELFGKPTFERPERELNEEREVVEKEPITAVEDSAELRLVNAAQLIAQRMEQRLKGFRKNLFLVEVKGLPPAILWSYAKNPQGIAPSERRRIEKAMGLPDGWVDKQLEVPV